MPDAAPRPLTRPPSLPNLGLWLLLVAALGLGLARVWAAPPGYNVDEWARLPSAIRLAGCWRQTAAWLTHAPGATSPAPCWRARHDAGNPAYYFLLSIPVAFFPDVEMDKQYYAARLVTVGLGLLTVGLAWLTGRELLGGRPRLALAIAAATALNQSFGDIVSGVNSDASAVVALAFLFYALARLQHRWRTLSPRGRVAHTALLAGALWLCRLSTSSAFWLALPVLAWWLLARLSARARWASAAVAFAAVAGLLLLAGSRIEWITPQYWFNAGPTEILGASTRVEAGGPLGSHALLLEPDRPRRRAHAEVQYLPEADARRLAGQTITFGAWLKGTAGLEIQSPIWEDGAQRVSRTVTATGDWQFVAATAQVSPTATAGAVVLAPPGSGPALYDGLVVVAGEYPTGEPPQFSDETGRTGQWGGRRFDNLLLNPSIEATWPTLRPEGLPRDVVAYNGRLRSFLAWRRTAPALPTAASWLLAGFWSEFSGLHPGLSRLGLLPLGLFSLAGVAGALAILLSRSSPADLKRAVGFFLPIAGIIWLTVLLRTDLWPNLPVVLSFAGARYAITATLPTMGLLILGGLYWLPRRWHGLALAALIAALWFISIHVLLRVQLPFYECLLSGITTGGCLQ